MKGHLQKESHTRKNKSKLGGKGGRFNALILGFQLRIGMRKEELSRWEMLY